VGKRARARARARASQRHEGLTWRWQSSADGGATWSDSWVIFYTRQADVR
jgi:hypothetical protein